MFSDSFGPTSLWPAADFVRASRNPIIRAGSGAWCADFIAASSVVQHDGQLRLYAEGSAGGHEQIGLFTRSADDIGGEWAAHPANPIVRVSSQGYDTGGVFDPAVVQFAGRWLMYFSATEGDAHEYAEQLTHGTAADTPGGEAIGLAVSDDGVTFTKHPNGPVLQARCPFAVVHGGRIHLFYVKVHQGGYRIHVAVSDDGVSFTSADPGPVLDVGPAGSWDSQSVTTPKVFAEGDLFWMAYAGDDTDLDDLTGIGLAWSTDLRTWTKVSKNPVFGPGEQAAFDCTSVQSPIMLPAGDTFAMIYSGSDATVGQGLHSQIGLAWLRNR